MSKVYRVYVEKRKDFAVEADEIFENLKTQLKLSNLEGVSVVNRYDVQGITKEVLDQGVDTISAEPMVDDVYFEDYPTTNIVFGIEFLPGQQIAPGVNPSCLYVLYLLFNLYCSSVTIGILLLITF